MALEEDVQSDYHDITKPAFQKAIWDEDYYQFVDDVDSNLKLSGTVANRPSSDNAPDDAWYEATDQNLIYRNDPSNGWVVIGHGDENNPVPEGNYETLNTGSIPSANVVNVEADDDAQNIIENAAVGTHIRFERGTTHDIIPPFEPPEGIFLDGGPLATNKADPPVTLRKAGDGDHLTVPDNLALRGIRFEGNESNYTGDGLVDAENDIAFPYFVGVHIRNQAGDGRVHDGVNRPVYIQTVIEGCGGFAVRETSSGVANPRHQHWLRGEWSRNDSGAHKIETGVWDSYFWQRMQNNNGPAIHMDGGNPHTVEWHGGIQGNDGPAFVQTDGAFDNFHVAAEVADNCQNIGLNLTSPIGQIHIEVSNSRQWLGTSSARWSASAHADASAISNQSANRLNWVNTDAQNRTGDTVDGDVAATIMDGEIWNANNFNGQSGLAFNPSNEWTRVLNDKEGAGTRFYWGYKSSEPYSPFGDGLGSLYFDDGTNTSDGNPHLRTDLGGAWTDI